MSNRGAIPSHLPDILQRFNIAPERWIVVSTEFEPVLGFDTGVRISVDHLHHCRSHEIPSFYLPQALF